MIANWLTLRMASQRETAEMRRLVAGIHRSLADDIRRLREDTGVPRAGLARAAGVDLSYLCRIEDGRERPSIATLARLATALGADFSARLYPNTGPAIRDRHQARIVEALHREAHPRWRLYPEVPVRQPSRGWIDIVLHAERERIVVASEIQSDLRRLEQLLRWFDAKVASLPSWAGWGHLGDIGDPSRLLIVRSTRSTRATAAEFPRQLRTAFPAHPADAIAALTTDAMWPGAALVWANVDGVGVRFVDHR